MFSKLVQAGKGGSSLSPIKVLMKNSPLSESSSKISKSLFINEISDTDFDSIQKIIAETELSDYQIQPSQFMIMKDKWELLAFWRIFPIGEKEEELGTLWVKEEKRGKKIGLALIQALLEKKRTKPLLYLACQKGLQTYYEKIGFHTTDKLPEKLFFTQKWAKENGYSFVIMQYAENSENSAEIRTSIASELFTLSS